jgi:hypothetical protein
MAVWISVSTEDFGPDLSARPPRDAIRRPTRGIVAKPNTYACLRVITATGEDLPFLDSSSYTAYDGIGESTHYYNFMITTVQDQRTEKSQIVETFGEDYVYFFGERPRFLNVQGVLLNTADFNWKNEFWANYERLLRGTRLVELNARMYFYFDDVIVEGFMMGAAQSYSSDNPHMLPLTFQMFVTNDVQLSTVGSIYFQSTTPLSETGAPVEGLAPPTEQARSDAAQRAANTGVTGGLNSFLAATQQYALNGDIAAQRQLDQFRNRYFPRNLVLPSGLTIDLPPIENQASFETAPTNAPIYDMTDEYVERPAARAEYDDQEIRRVNEEREKRTPEQLEKKARDELKRLGVNVDSNELSRTLLGRGAFTAARTTASFGIVQAGGTLTLPPL